MAEQEKKEVSTAIMPCAQFSEFVFDMSLIAHQIHMLLKDRFKPTDNPVGEKQIGPRAFELCQNAEFLFTLLEGVTRQYWRDRHVDAAQGTHVVGVSEIVAADLFAVLHWLRNKKKAEWVKLRNELTDIGLGLPWWLRVLGREEANKMAKETTP